MAEEYSLHFERIGRVIGRGPSEVHFSIQVKSDMDVSQISELISKEMSEYENNEWRFNLSGRDTKLEVVISNIDVAKDIAKKYGSLYYFNFQLLQLNIIDYIEKYNASNIYATNDILLALKEVTHYFEIHEND